MGRRPTFCLRIRQEPTGTVPGTADEISPLIEPSLEAMGYRLVRVAFTGGRRATLQIMAERRDDAPMTVDDCADDQPLGLGDARRRRSDRRRLHARGQLARHRPAAGAARGFRPLRRLRGQASSWPQPIDGRKRFRGRLLGRRRRRRSGSSPRRARSRCRFAAIAKAKLVLTDELIAAPAAKRPLTH